MSHSTKGAEPILGRHLLQDICDMLPPGTTRVVIDIPVNDVVKVYYQTIDPSIMQSLDFGALLNGAQLKVLS